MELAVKQFDDTPSECGVSVDHNWYPDSAFNRTEIAERQRVYHAKKFAHLRK